MNKTLRSRIALSALALSLSPMLRAEDGGSLPSTAISNSYVATNVLSAPESIYFVDIEKDQKIAVPVLIFNKGRDNITINRIEFSNSLANPGDANLKFGIDLPITIGPNKKEVLKVTFEPKQDGRYTGRIYIFTEESNHPIIRSFCGYAYDKRYNLKKGSKDWGKNWSNARAETVSTPNTNACLYYMYQPKDNASRKAVLDAATKINSYDKEDRADFVYAIEVGLLDVLLSKANGK